VLSKIKTTQVKQKTCFKSKTNLSSKTRKSNSFARSNLKLQLHLESSLEPETRIPPWKLSSAGVMKLQYVKTTRRTKLQFQIKSERCVGSTFPNVTTTIAVPSNQKATNCFSTTLTRRKLNYLDRKFTSLPLRKNGRIATRALIRKTFVTLNLKTYLSR